MNQYAGIIIGNLFIFIPILIVLTSFQKLGHVEQFFIMFLPAMVGMMIMIDSILMHEDKNSNDKITEKESSN